jgi:hypothetical protein
MPKYIPASEYKAFNSKMFNPSEARYMSKKKVVKKFIERLNGERKKKKLEKALNKLNVEDIIMLGLLFEKAIEKETV